MLAPAGGGSAILGVDGVITGTEGRLTGDWTSQGLIAIDEPGTIVMSGSFTGGTIRSRNDGTLDFRGAVLSGVRIEAGPGSSFGSDSGTRISDSTIVDAYTIQQGDTMTFGADVVIEDEVVLHDDGSTATAVLEIEDGQILNGRVRLAGPLVVPNAVLRPTTDGVATLGPDGAVVGTRGTLSGAWVIEGLLAPGHAAAPVGRITLTGVDFDFASTSHIEIDVAGGDAFQFDRIGGSGSLRLHGGLDVGFVDGYSPEPRDQFEIIRATSVDGLFSEISIEPVGSSGPAHVVYTGEAVVVVICAADRDADGELTIFDFLAFRDQFDAGDAQADLDGDGRLTLFDFLAFQNRFDDGCG